MNKIKFISICDSLKRGSLYKVQTYNFVKKELTLTQKMRMIYEKEQKSTRGHEEELEFIQEKTQPLIKKSQMMRFPAYLAMPLLIWTHPLSIASNTVLLFSNYYMIFLTSLEATSLFCLGLNFHNLVVGQYSTEEKEKEFIRTSRAVIRKRLFIMIFFFSFMILAGHLGSEYNTTQSMTILFFSNIYLYAKFSYHITLYGLNKNTFTRRSKNAAMNLFLILSIGVVAYRKQKFVKNNLVYGV